MPNYRTELQRHDAEARIGVGLIGSGFIGKSHTLGFGT
jgi:hypothetical protein